MFLLLYRDFQGKISASQETPEQQMKILNIVINSASKEEIINKIAEEKIRGIFYGNPADFFLKDKAKIGLGDCFKTNFVKAIKEYKEVIARRNAVMHNEGRVDRKYLREVENPVFTLDQKVEINKEYITNSIFLLYGLASVVVKQVIVNNYNPSYVNKKLDKFVVSFTEKYKN